MFESPSSESQNSRLEKVLLQMKNELEARWRSAQSVNRSENPYDLIDAVLDNQDLTISERLKAKTSLIAHLRKYTQ